MLHVPMALLLVIISLSALGLWGILRHWRYLAELQLRLDRCVGGVALALKADARTIRLSNREMMAIRAALSVAVEPASRTALQTALLAEAARQEWVRLRWNARRLSWLARLGCATGRGDRPVPLAEFPWTRDPPDALGSRPLRLTLEPLELRVQLGHFPRHAAAELRGESSEMAYEKVRWVPPRRTFGTGFP